MATRSSSIVRVVAMSAILPLATLPSVSAAGLPTTPCIRSPVRYAQAPSDRVAIRQVPSRFVCVILFEFDFSVIRHREYGSFGMRLFVFRDALGASRPVVREWLRGGKCSALSSPAKAGDPVFQRRE